MAWHILHGLLEQVRVHSTFAGKLWIIMMFIFRIVVVARIGDMVYHDEQSSFICNTLTPGCPNVCFNQFSPISQLRYWSLMVLVVAVPGILFCVYAGHKIYHAHVKYPNDDGGDEEKVRKKWEATDNASDGCIHPPTSKRYKYDLQAPPGFMNATAPPLYEVTRLNATSKKNGDLKYGSGVNRKEKDALRRRKFQDRAADDEDKDLLEKRPGSTTDNNCTSTDELAARKWQWGTNRMSYPIYADAQGRRVAYISKPKPCYTEEIRANKQRRIMLENPTLYRAYWWHVVARTLLEVGALVGQYFLYGLVVPELFVCPKHDPCPKPVDCYVSRPMEKSCLMWLMYGLGAFACILSIAEFWSLGWVRFKNAVCCGGQSLTYEEKRRWLAKLNAGDEKKQHDPDQGIVMAPHGRFTSPVRWDSLSSVTTVESV